METINYIRNCPKCNKEIEYKKEWALLRSIKNKDLCKSCKNKIWNESHKQQKKEYDKIYRQKPEVKKRNKEYFKRPELIKKKLEYMKEYTQRIKVQKRIKKYRKEYNQKLEVKEKRKLYTRKRRQDPIIKLENNMATSMRDSLKRKNISKNGRNWESLVGYTSQNLKSHLEKKFQPGMTWENYGKWHIDHIIPRTFFQYKSVKNIEFKYCWSLDNLQPLWAKDNLSKSAKILN